jgi:phosphate-selective porin
MNDRGWLMVPALLAGLTLSPAALAGEAGKDDKQGFAIKEGDFSLQTEFWLQGKVDYLSEEIEFSGDLWDVIGASDTEIDPKADWSVRRARAIFYGTAFKPWLHWRLEGEYGLGQTRVLDAYLAAKVSAPVNVMLGQFKSPFDLYQLFRDRDLMFVEKPVMTDEFAPGRDVGVMYFGSAADRRFNWRVAVQNGDGINTTNSDDSLLTTLRFEVQNKGGFDYQESAFNRPDALQWTAGISWLATGSGTLTDDNTNAGDNDGSCTPGVDEKCGYQSVDQDAVELFAAVRGNRWQANLSYQLWSFERGRIDDRNQPVDLDIDAWTAEFGIFVCDNWELALRYGLIEDQDEDFFFDPEVPLAPPVISEREDSEWRFGVNRYFLENNLKLQVDFGEYGFEFKDRLELGPGDVLTGENTGKVRGLRALLSFFI